MPGDRRTRAPPLVFVGIAHAVAIALILVFSPVPQRFVEWPESLVVIDLPEAPPRPETTLPVRNERRSARRPERIAATPGPVMSEDSTAPTALPRVDWQRELEASAKAKADKTPWRSVTPPPKVKPKKEFGWDRKHTNRIEHGGPGELPALHIGDHCVLIGFLIPACAFGKIPPRTDLFEDMKDPDRPSSVPEAPPSDVVHSKE